LLADTLVDISIDAVLLEPLRRQGIASKPHITLAGKAGSGRTYYRLSFPEQAESFILMQAPSTDADFMRSVHYTRFFAECGLPVPHIYAWNETCGQILYSDLGNTLFLHEVEPRPSGYATFYFNAMRLLHQLQARASGPATINKELFDRKMDYKGLRWESSYFTEQYLHQHLGLDIGEHSDLLVWMDELAHRVADHPQKLIHRDFQSQNIMVLDRDLFMIDFQGARIGSELYDLASLLWDPYVELSLDDVRSFFNYFHKLIRNGYSKKENWQFFLEASAQRLMQACGAYCFLSNVKGYKQFAPYLPPGLRQLKLVCELAGFKELQKHLSC
jgi:N-acetylmuramate 1-kinase